MRAPTRFRASGKRQNFVALIPVLHSIGRTLRAKFLDENGFTIFSVDAANAAIKGFLRHVCRASLSLFASQKIKWRAFLGGNFWESVDSMEIFCQGSACPRSIADQLSRWIFLALDGAQKITLYDYRPWIAKMK
jgi:hypothetical protein